MAYNKINWENGTIEQDGYVNIDGVRYPITMPEYSGETPVNADNLGHMDDQIELISNYISNRYQSLWTGTWSSGSITVPNSSKYHSFIVISGNIPIVCYRNSAGRISGASATTPDNTRYDRLFAATADGDVWTMNWIKELRHNANSNHSAFTTSNVTEIIGLDPIIE